MINNINYGRKLKIFRERAGLTQEEAADLIGIARTTLIRYERESPNRLPVTVFIKMAALYDIDVFDVFGVHDDSFLEYDVSPYYLFKCHAYHMTKKEYKRASRFGGVMSGTDYSGRYRKNTEDTVRSVLRSPVITDDERAEIEHLLENDTDFKFNV